MTSLYWTLFYLFVYNKYALSTRVIFTCVNINLERTSLCTSYQCASCAYDIIACIAHGLISRNRISFVDHIFTLRLDTLTLVNKLTPDMMINNITGPL